MAPEARRDASELLARLAGGDARAANELLPIVYGELRALAGSYLRQPAGAHTLQPTALVHEAYLKLVGPAPPARFESRAHFLAVAARAMRSVLVDHARRKRGGRAASVAVEDVAALFEERAPDLLALDAALERLAQHNAELASLVELRFFGGLSIEETADVLAISRPTLMRRWRAARLWLRREIAG